MADTRPLREASSTIVALAVVLYAVQRSTVGLPAELLMVAEHLFFILEVHSAYPSISLPAAVVIPGLLIFADDQINYWLLDGVIPLQFGFELMVFVCLSTFFYFVSPDLLKDLYPKASINLAKGLRSAGGSTRFAKKLLLHGPSFASFRLLYAILFIKLGFTSVIHYVYSVATKHPTNLKAEGVQTAVKVCILTSLAMVMHYLAIDFALVCDLTFLWWFGQATLRQ
jgi:hypothetical protein